MQHVPEATHFLLHVPEATHFQILAHITCLGLNEG